MTGFRIVYVPGMKPKPAPDVHRRELVRSLEFGLEGARPDAARVLREHGDRFGLVAWTYSFYESHRDIGHDLPGIEALYSNPSPSAGDRAEIDSFKRRIARWWHLIGDSIPVLGRLIARPELRATLAEVHRYFGDEGGIGTRLRGMLKDALREAFRGDERVLLMAHSLGTVIAYDSLWELSRAEGEEGRVDLFVTLGSPLATRFIRKSLRGADRRGADRYPANIRRWANFSARGEMTALHPRLAPFFGGIVEAGLTEYLADETDLYNHFRDELRINVHKSYGYLANAKVAGAIGDWLLERPAG